MTLCCPQQMHKTVLQFKMAVAIDHTGSMDYFCMPAFLFFSFVIWLPSFLSDLDPMSWPQSTKHLFQMPVHKSYRDNFQLSGSYWFVAQLENTLHHFAASFTTVSPQSTPVSPGLGSYFQKHNLHAWSCHIHASIRCVACSKVKAWSFCLRLFTTLRMTTTSCAPASTFHYFLTFFICHSPSSTITFKDSTKPLILSWGVSGINVFNPQLGDTQLRHAAPQTVQFSLLSHIGSLKLSFLFLIGILMDFNALVSLLILVPS